MPPAIASQVSEFIHEQSWDDLPANVKNTTRRSLIDLVATLAAGTQTRASHIIRDYCSTSFSGSEAAIAFDGRGVTKVGAAFANATSLDSMDAHDGHRLAKGHAGAGSLAAVLATCDEEDEGSEFLLRLVIGYEIGLRAAITLHSTSQTYHSSGSWIALGAAAIAARSMGLDAERTEHALGIAEYHGPRSPMMRCIDHPTMVKDGTGWGTMTGVMAAELAAAGFTGAPADVIGIGQAALWNSLGDEWRILESYYKPYPICRWAQPAIAAALALQNEHRLEVESIERIEVETFSAASRLDHPAPTTTEQAQYSLPFPLAMAMLEGRLSPSQVMGRALADERALALADRVDISIDPVLDAEFPEKTLARVSITTRAGAELKSEIHNAPGDVAQPLADTDLIDKFKNYCQPLLGTERTDQLLTACQHLDRENQIKHFVELIQQPPLAVTD